ncbi:MAG: 6-phosphofructokinase [Calditrichaceae bacterium]
MGIVTEAIDRLHSTAMSHGRIIVVEVMGHRAGWLALGAGMAGGADVILIPEIPYDLEVVTEAILQRARAGKMFSIVAVAEGAMSDEQAKKVNELAEAKKAASSKAEKRKTSAALEKFHTQHISHTVNLTNILQKKTRLESKLTVLGHLQRGGTPSSADRVLATRLGTAASKALNDGKHGVLVAARGENTELVPLEQVAGNKKFVPQNHPWIFAARDVGTCLGIKINKE